MTSPTATPILGPAGKPIRRRGRWTFVSHQYNGPVWRLDGTTRDLEYDPLDSSLWRQGSWILYVDGRYKAPVAHYLSCAMEEVEEQFDRSIWGALGGTWL